MENTDDEDDKFTDQELFTTLLAEFKDERDDENPDKEQELLMIDINLDFYVLDGSKQEFLGACLGTGATVSVVGLKQAEEYCRMMNVSLVIEPKRNRSFKFGSERKPSKGVVRFWMPYAGDQIINISLDVVDINVPLILGLDKLEEYKMYVNNVENILVCTEPKHKHHITRKLGHLW